MTDGNKDTSIISELADMIGAMGSIDFAVKLDEFVAGLADYDMTAIFVYSKKQLPILLYDGFREHGTKSALNNYLKGSYLLDAVYQSAVANPREGLSRLRDLAPDEFFNSDYFHTWAVHPCISADSGSLAEEIIFFKTLSCGAMATYSLMRNNDKSPFNDTEFSRLKSYEQVICNAIERNWFDLKTTESEDSTREWTRSSENMEHGFETFASDKLTPRECMVVRLLLQGHSVASTAQELSIAPGTIKNHKKNIYLKLNISSMSELFSLFIHHILPY